MNYICDPSDDRTTGAIMYPLEFENAIKTNKQEKWKNETQTNQCDLF